MKVVHVVHIVFNFSTGGLENGLVNLINRLPEDKFKHSIVCLQHYDIEFYQRIETSNCQIYSIDKPPGKSLRYFVDLYRLLKTLKPNIVHTRNLSTLECQVVAWFAGIKQRIHGEHGWDSANAKAATKSRYLRKLFSYWVKRYIVLSKEGFQYLTSDININHSKISLICNGVDIDKFKPTKLIDRSRRLNILTVGRLAQVKNQLLLLSALKHYCQKHEVVNIQLTIVGEGPCRESLEQYIENYNLQKHCQLLGNRSDVAHLMQQADIFVLPSFAEGISNTILEAMASGLPIVATNVGGNVELVSDGSNGYLIDVEADKKLSELFERYEGSRSSVTHQGRESRKLAESRFSLDVMVAQYQQLYLEMLN